MTSRHQSVEERRVLNPAFAGALIAQTAIGHETENGEGLPFVYAYLVLPLIMHPETRERIPASVVTRLLNWTERNPDIAVDFFKRLADLRHASREGLLLVTSTGVATVGERGQIKVVSAQKALEGAEKKNASNEVRDCLKRAKFLGRWLATSGAPAAVLTALGVRL